MKNVEIGLLLDYYGEFLTERQKLLIDLHYNQDYSLFEIAQQENISRQGVYDAIKRGENALYQAEERLGLVSKQEMMMTKLQRLKKQMSTLESCIARENKETQLKNFQAANAILETIIHYWEDEHGV